MAVAVEPGVAGLDSAEQAFLGRQQRPPAVDVDRAPFHHDAADRPSTVDPRHPAAQAELRGHPARQRSSWRWLSYFAQALNRQSTRPTRSRRRRRGR